MSSANPFKRFAFGAAAATDAKRVKREEHSAAADGSASPSVVKAEDGSSNASTELLTDASVDASSSSPPPPPAEDDCDVRVTLLRRLLRAREAMTTPIDRFGTHACVAPRAVAASTRRFHVLVAALLSSQTKDEVTHAAMQRLHRELAHEDAADEGVTVATARAADEDALDALLRPVGFHRKKAQQLKQVAETLHRCHGGDVPRSLDELVALPGVGPKIARVVLLLAWGRVDGLVVDTHVHRLARRLGWTTGGRSTLAVGDAKSPEDTRAALEEWVPRECWRGFSRAVVGFGQSVCVAARPKCAACPLADLCPSAFRVSSANDE